MRPHQHTNARPAEARHAFAEHSTVVEGRAGYRPKCAAFFSVKWAHFSGRSSCAKMAETGQAGTQAPQSMHSTGSMNNCSDSAKPASSFLGWMQSTGQASTQAVSLVPIQGSAITYAIVRLS